MTTPLIMLAILAVPLAIVWNLRRLGLRVSLDVAGVLGLVLLFLFTASGHFVQAQAMAEMLPPLVAAHVPLIYATGVLELALSLGIALPPTRRLAGLAAIAVLVLFFPANVYAAFAQVEMGGHTWGPVYLLIRAPLQVLLIAWTWAVRRACGAIGSGCCGAGCGARTGLLRVGAAGTSTAGPTNPQISIRPRPFAPPSTGRTWSRRRSTRPTRQAAGPDAVQALAPRPRLLIDSLSRRR